MTAQPPEQEGLPREAKYAIGSVTGCLGSVCLLCVGFLLVASVPDVVGLPLSIAAAAVPAILYVFAVIWLDRYEREPISILLGTFFWGSVIAVVLALILELAVSLSLSVVAGAEVADAAVSVVGAPLMEEASKGFVLLLLFFLLRNEFDDTLDGIIYGSVVGLGFAMTENVLYFGGQYLEGGTSALAELFVIRVVLSGLAHALYTGSTGAGLGFARETTNRALKMIVPPAAFALAVGQHLAWNGTVQVLGALIPESSSFLDLLVIVASMSLVLSGPVFLVLLTIVVLSWRRERQVIREYLAGEVESGQVTEAEYSLLSSSWLRTRSLYGALFSRGLRYWYYLRKLYQAETELAFAKWHQSQDGGTRVRSRLGPVERYRSRIVDVRARLEAM